MTTRVETKKDLVVLVPDLDTENAIRGLLARNESFGIHPLRENLDYEFQRATNRDNGCRSAAEALLAPALHRFKRALVVFDREGCGQDSEPREAIESDVESRLETSGWRIVAPLSSSIPNWKPGSGAFRHWLVRSSDGETKGSPFGSGCSIRAGFVLNP